MSDGSNRKITTFRLPPELLVQFTSYAKAHGVSKTYILETLIEALLEDRLTLCPRSGPNAFPAAEIEVGSTPHYPALIAPGVQRETEDA
jgi:hypothetical protein